jgi:archaemetzincin
MTPVRRVLAGLGAVIAIGLVGLLLPGRAAWQPPARPDLSGLGDLLEARSRIRPLYRPKGPPQPDDWLLKHAERGQTFDQYLVARLDQPVCKGYQTIYLLPLGDFTPLQEQVLAQTQDALGRFFAMPVTMLDRVALDRLPAHARRTHPRWGDEQMLTTYLLGKVLMPRRPEDAAAVLGLTAGDLWPGSGNFVFGQASLAQRVGVWSLYRNGDPAEGPEAYRQCLRRTIKTAVHETGHMLGMLHCTAYECGMNGSNNRDECDRQPLEFCSECQAKIWWTCGADPLRRAESLAEFARLHGLADEEGHWQELINCLKGR